MNKQARSEATILKILPVKENNECTVNSSFSLPWLHASLFTQAVQIPKYTHQEKKKSLEAETHLPQNCARNVSQRTSLQTKSISMGVDLAATQNKTAKVTERSEATYI